MKKFLKPNKATLIIYSIFLIDAVQTLIWKMADITFDPWECGMMDLCKFVIILKLVLLPIKLFVWPFFFVEYLPSPIISFLLLIFIYYIYASSITFLFTKKRKLFYLFLIAMPIASVILYFGMLYIPAFFINKEGQKCFADTNCIHLAPICEEKNKIFREQNLFNSVRPMCIDSACRCENPMIMMHL